MWRTVKLGEYINVQNGYAFNSKLFDADGEIGLIRIRDLKEGVSTETKYTGDYDRKFVVQRGDLLIGMDGEFRCYEWKGEDALLNQRVCRLQDFDSELDKRFLLYAINDELKKIEDVTGFTTVKHLSSKAIKEIPLYLPPLAEQQRIVAKLDAAFAKIDEAIKFNIQKYDELDNLFNSYMGKKFNSEEFPRIKLSEVCDFIGGSQPPKSVFEYEETASNIRLIQIRDYKSDNHIVYIPKDKARRFCSKSDVMIGRYGPPIFQILRGIEGSYNVALMKAVPKDSILNDYLFYFLKNPKIQNFVIKQSIRAAGQSGVNKDALEPYQMHLPSISHQKEIVKKVTQFEANILEVKRIYQAKLENLHVLKTAMLAQELQSEAA